MKKTIIKIVVWGTILLALGYFGYNYFFPPKEIYISFQNEPLRKTSLFKEVLATGTINPIEVVEVGTQVSGIISEVYVDFNDKVKKGQVIAKMDMRNLEASLEEVKTNLVKSQLSVAQAKRDMERMNRLFEEGAVSGLETVRAKDTYDIALENLNIDQLQIKKNKVNLGYATIISPIDGIVVARSIDKGQTVAASFATPTLFRIANDLSKMKIEASVDEADIGKVKKGQQVSFTVDAYENEDFNGVVDELQLQPILIQNVVTYKVIILFDNPGSKLLPGMTATLLIKTEVNPVSTVVPDAAFAFAPPTEFLEILQKEGYELIALEGDKKNTIWIKNGLKLLEKRVSKTFTNGIYTAIEGYDSDIDSVLTNLDVQVVNTEETGNIFTSMGN